MRMDYNIAQAKAFYTLRVQGLKLKDIQQSSEYNPKGLSEQWISSIVARYKRKLEQGRLTHE